MSKLLTSISDETCQELAGGRGTPNPMVEPDLPGARGNIIATMNHGSGLNEFPETDSRGIGYFFRDGATIRFELERVRTQYT